MLSRLKAMHKFVISLSLFSNKVAFKRIMSVSKVALLFSNIGLDQKDVDFLERYVPMYIVSNFY